MWPKQFFFHFAFRQTLSNLPKKYNTCLTCNRVKLFVVVISSETLNNLHMWCYSENRTFCKVMCTKLELTYFCRGRWVSHGRERAAKLCAENVFSWHGKSSGIMPADRKRMLCWILNLIWANILILVSKISCRSEQYMEVWIFASNS